MVTCCITFEHAVSSQKPTSSSLITYSLRWYCAIYLNDFFSLLFSVNACFYINCVYYIYFIHRIVLFAWHVYFWASIDNLKKKIHLMNSLLVFWWFSLVVQRAKVRLIQSYRFVIFMENIFMDSEAGFMKIIFKTNKLGNVLMWISKKVPIMSAVGKKILVLICICLCISTTLFSSQTIKT